MTNNKSNGAVTAKAETLPASKIEEMVKLAGVGLESVTTDDLPTPRLKLLQSNSDEVTEGHDKYVDGARAGRIFNSAGNNVYGADGIKVIVCGYEKQWPEWQERGTGSSAPVNVFTPQNKPTDAVRGDDGKFRLPNGNYIEETANFYVLILGGATPQPAILSMSKTGLKHARNWAYSLKNEFIQNPKTKKLFLAPSWYRIYTLKSRLEKNDKGNWYGWEITKDEFLNDENIFDAASQFNDSVRKGKVVAKYDEEGSSDEQSGDTPF